MANGGVIIGGQPGERETTNHGVVNDITVPTLRWRQLLMCDEIMIAAAMLMLPIGASFLGTWVLPVYGLVIAAMLLRTVLDGVVDQRDIMPRLAGAVLVCGVVFGVCTMLRDPIARRLISAGEAIWQWPPQVGLFLKLIAFLALPFFVPVFTRTPLLTRFFKITLLDPSWPPPRAARDREGIFDPDALEPGELEAPEPQQITVVARVETMDGKQSVEIPAGITNYNGFLRLCRAVHFDGKHFSKAEAKRHGVDEDEMDKLLLRWAQDDRLIYQSSLANGKTPVLTHGGKAMVKQYAQTPLLGGDDHLFMTEGRGRRR